MLLSFTSYLFLCDTRNLYAIQGIFMNYVTHICVIRKKYYLVHREKAKRLVHKGVRHLCVNSLFNIAFRSKNYTKVSDTFV